jgi:hypothetical protein
VFFISVQSIGGLHGGEHSSRGLLGCEAVSCCSRIPTFRRTLLPPEHGGQAFMATSFSDTSMSALLIIAKQRQRQQGPQEHCHSTTTLHGVTIQMIST